ncbi:hypothetical protein ACTZWW_18735 [Salinarimonas sp. NSM]|uniref:hypothetical protein n=1 Tax=Salinarimonas sp. NSM TaxID=3458003 RepID=UPI004037523F
MMYKHDDSHHAKPLEELRIAAATAFALERLALVGGVEDDRALCAAWERADAAALEILSRRDEPPSAAIARYEASLWLAGGIDDAQTESPVPGPVPGSIEAASIPGLVAMCASAEGLAEVRRVADECAGAMASSARSIAEADPDASVALGLVAEFTRKLAASAAERLRAHEPRTRVGRR